MEILETKNIRFILDAIQICLYVKDIDDNYQLVDILSLDKKDEISGIFPHLQWVNLIEYDLDAPND